MKIKNVIKACKQRRRIVLVQKDDENWLGDGASLWLMPRYLDCSEDGIFCTFDFSEAERSKVIYSENSEAQLNIDIYSENEGEAEIMNIALVSKGEMIRPIKTETGIIYIREKYFDIFSDKLYSLKIKRMEREMPLIAVYEGYLLIGIIMPYAAASGELCDLLDMLYKDMKAELER